MWCPFVFHLFTLSVLAGSWELTGFKSGVERAVTQGRDTQSRPSAALFIGPYVSVSDLSLPSVSHAIVTSWTPAGGFSDDSTWWTAVCHQQQLKTLTGGPAVEPVHEKRKGSDDDIQSASDSSFFLATPVWVQPYFRLIDLQCWVPRKLECKWHTLCFSTLTLFFNSLSVSPVLNNKYKLPPPAGVERYYQTHRHKTYMPPGSSALSPGMFRGCFLPQLAHTWADVRRLQPTCVLCVLQCRLSLAWCVSAFGCKKDV